MHTYGDRGEMQNLILDSWLLLMPRCVAYTTLVSQISLTNEPFRRQTDSQTFTSFFTLDEHHTVRPY